MSLITAARHVINDWAILVLVNHESCEQLLWKRKCNCWKQWNLLTEVKLPCHQVYSTWTVVTWPTNFWSQLLQRSFIPTWKSHKTQKRDLLPSLHQSISEPSPIGNTPSIFTSSSQFYSTSFLFSSCLLAFFILSLSWTSSSPTAIRNSSSILKWHVLLLVSLKNKDVSVVKSYTHHACWNQASS